MRRCLGRAVVATLAAFAAGCMGGGSHGTLSAKDALAQTRNDGFVKANSVTPGSWLYGRTTASDGVVGNPNLVTADYAITFEDKRAPTRLLMMVIVFPNAATAQRCLKGSVYQSTHIPVEGYDAEGDGPYRPVTVIDPTTIRISRHAPGAPGSEFPADDGEYNTWVAQGRAFGLGFSRNMPHAKIVREDLERLASEIAG